MYDEKAKKQLEGNYEEAQKILNDKDKLDKFLLQLEEKLKIIPLVGDKLAYVPVMAALLKDYATGKYDKIPLGSIMAVVAALMYFVSPVDLVPDVIPGVGYIDDAAVVLTCWNLVESDIKEYEDWRNS